MAEKVEIEYGTEKVQLSRVYPFGEVVTVGRGKNEKKVTEVTVTESNGFDEELVAKQADKGKNAGYAQISISVGITYDEALSLAGKDSQKIVEVLQGF